MKIQEGRKPYQIKIDLFEGPLDLLWNLITKSKLDITQISLSQITEDFLRYIHLLKSFDIEVASDFILMAATLLHYKSRMLLPFESDLKDDENYSLPAELVQQLLEYKRFQQVADKLFTLEQETAEIFIRSSEQSVFEFADDDNWQEVNILDLLAAFSKIAEKFDQRKIESIEIDDISVEECIQRIKILGKLKTNFLFHEIFSAKPSKIELVATFLAILEMVKLKKISIRQHNIFGDIRIFFLDTNL
jgi:segregation and condensation protein A